MRIITKTIINKPVYFLNHESGQICRNDAGMLSTLVLMWFDKSSPKDAKIKAQTNENSKELESIRSITKIS